MADIIPPCWTISSTDNALAPVCLNVLPHQHTALCDVNAVPERTIKDPRPASTGRPQRQSVCTHVYTWTPNNPNPALETVACPPAGMADILSPFLVVFPSKDALAFMCFAALMGQIRQNFLEGQPGVHSSLQQIAGLLQQADAKLWKQIGQLACCFGHTQLLWLS